MNARAMKAYKNIAAQTAVSEASPVELIVLVYKRLLDNLRMAQKAMEEGKENAEYISRALDLIQKGLAAALDHEKGGEIAQNLAALYDWSLREILQARLKNNPLLLSGVIEVFFFNDTATTEIYTMREQGNSAVAPMESVESKDFKGLHTST